MEDELMQLRIDQARRAALNEKTYWDRSELLFMSGIGETKLYALERDGFPPPWLGGGSRRHVVADSAKVWIHDLKSGKFASSTGK
jgi:hypothetical protein